MLEIYNEKTQDLLVDISKRPPSGLKIRENKLLGPYVENLSKHPVTSYEEISDKMEQGGQNRTIGSTLMNATSSRAHTIITIEFKQIESEPGKPKSQKVSVINLVDLAGSERSSSTGATGDRLKEGCNINKSLLVLGNVINVLADKAIGGKNKNMLPPYRDSALTRILQSALGGNSKTVMICAASPADINYEETLSTLRYADRAKKIQNKAVINESEQDKMVRLLKEENLVLKKQLESLSVNILPGQPIRESDQAELLKLKEEYEANMKLMESMEKTFQEKLKEAKEAESLSIGQRVDIKQPHLVVLNEDPQLSHKLKYSLVSLPVHVGRKNAHPTPQIALSGIGIKVNHAFFDKDKLGRISLTPKDPAAKEYIFINGKKIPDQGQTLYNMDRIIFGTNTVLLYLTTSDGEELYQVDWEQAQVQLQEELEKEAHRQEMEKERLKQEEIEDMKKNLEEKFIQEKREMEERLKVQLKEYEEKMKKASEEERAKIEKEKKNIESILQEDEEISRRNKRMSMDKFNFVRATEEKSFVHKSEKLTQTLSIIVRKMLKMRDLITRMHRNYHVDLFLTRNIELERASTNILIKVENYEKGEMYYWSVDTFNNRYDMLKELYEDNEEEFDQGKKVDTPQEEDPLFDEPKQSLVGYSFLSLQSFAYFYPHSITIPIFSAANGHKNGEIAVTMNPLDEEGKLIRKAVADPANQLLGKFLKAQIIFKKLKDLDKNYWKDFQLEYYAFNEKHKTSSQVIKKEVASREVVLDIAMNHEIDFIQKDTIDYLMNEKLIIKVFAVERVEMIGVMPRKRESIKKLAENLQVRDKRFKTVSAQRKPEKEKKDCLIF